MRRLQISSSALSFFNVSRSSCDYYLNSHRFQSSPSPTPSAPPSAAKQIAQEKDEHDRYMDFIRNTQKVLTLHCTPKRLCSASRIIRQRETNPKAIQQAQGRGLVATKDVYAGNVVAAAPVLEVGIFADKLIEAAMRSAESETNPFRESYRTMPTFETCCRVAGESAGFRDGFVGGQGHLALCVALERMNPKSKYAAYLDTLPVPAVDDKHVLELYKDLLGEDKAVFFGHYKDHHDFIVALEQEWRKAAGNGSKNILVPPIQVIDWAWRTTLARQSPLPVYAKPMMSIEDQRMMGVGYHYMNWVSINETNPDATLYPTLVPFFDLVDHGPSSNVRIDIVTRKVTYGFGSGGERARIANETMHNAPSHRSGETLFGKMKRKVMKQVGGVIGKATAASSSSSDDGSSGSRKSSFLNDDEEYVAYLELQALTDIRAGEELTLKFAVEENSERAFSLYRYGFLPVTH